MDVLHQRIGFYMTLGLQSSAFRRHMRYNPKYAPNVYRLIDVAFIRNFFDEPSLFQNQNLGQMLSISTLGAKGITSSSKICFNWARIRRHAIHLQKVDGIVNNDRDSGKQEHSVIHDIAILKSWKLLIALHTMFIVQFLWKSIRNI